MDLQLVLVIGDSPNNKKLTQNNIMNKKCYYVSLWPKNCNQCGPNINAGFVHISIHLNIFTFLLCSIWKILRRMMLRRWKLLENQFFFHS
jgi:hypothetical protein